MKTIIIFLLLLPSFLFCQSMEFNLKGINSLNVNLYDKSDLINASTTNKIITETKLKIKSAGIELGDNANFIISINHTPDNYALIWIRLEELVEVNRLKNKVTTYAITYSNNKYCSSGLWNFDNKILKTVDELVNEFIEAYFFDNEKKQ